jgi:hypothetical protein
MESPMVRVIAGRRPRCGEGVKSRFGTATKRHEGFSAHPDEPSPIRTESEAGFLRSRRGLVATKA